MARSICLITPPSLFLLDERVFMNLGILKVAAVLEAADVSVEMLDLSGVENYLDAVRDHASNTDANHFGITATTPQLPAASKIAGAIRGERPMAKIILGGPHVTLVNAASKREVKLGNTGRAYAALGGLQEMFDVLVAGDGERAVFQALKTQPPTLIDADDPKSELFLDDAGLSVLPFPARHLVDVDSYNYNVEGKRALSLIAQLGCPFECGFCGGRQSPFLRRVRMRSGENVVDEMLHMSRTYGVEGFMLYDDELNVNTQMVDLMGLIRDAQDSVGADWRLRGFIKAQLFSEDQAAAMYAAGFRWILVGFESGSPRILENINKRATLEDNNRCLAIARRHGLKVKALMSIGHPGESRETVSATRDWLLEVAPDDFDITIITTYPGTPYYDYAMPFNGQDNTWVYEYEKTGDRLYSQEVNYTQVADYYKGAPGEYRSYVYTDHLSAERLVAMRDWVESSVRKRLNIPDNPSAASVLYEHSMGQVGPNLPSHILRTTGET